MPVRDFKLTEKVKYIRVNPAGEPERGEGMIMAHIINPQGRENFQIKDGEKVYNLEPKALDCTDEEETAYLEHVKYLRGMADDFNKRSDEVINEGNVAVDAANNAFFGPKMLP